MATVLDFTKFTFTAEQIRSVKELLFDEVLESPEISLLHTVYPGIVYDKEIGFVGRGGLVGVAKQGCNPTPQAYNVGTRKVVWTPKGWEILIAQCASDIEATAAVYSLKTGVDVDDFSDSDYVAIILEVLAQSVKEFIIRLVWFSNIDAANVEDGGEITNDVDVKYFNILDGFFKQMSVQITANPSQRVAITENAGATYATQVLPSSKAQGYLKPLVYDANMVLRGKENSAIYCTQSFYDAYEQSLAGTALETMYANLVNGQKTLTFKGVKLIALPLWDAIIAQYFNTGTKLINPHRVVYITKDVLAIGVDSEASFGETDVWYNKDSREVKIESKGKADAKLLNPGLFQIGI